MKPDYHQHEDAIESHVPGRGHLGGKYRQQGEQDQELDTEVLQHLEFWKEGREGCRGNQKATLR